MNIAKLYVVYNEDVTYWVSAVDGNMAIEYVRQIEEYDNEVLNSQELSLDSVKNINIAVDCDCGREKIMPLPEVFKLYEQGVLACSEW